MQKVTSEDIRKLRLLIRDLQTSVRALELDSQSAASKGSCSAVTATPSPDSEPSTSTARGPGLKGSHFSDAVEVFTT